MVSVTARRHAAHRATGASSSTTSRSCRCSTASGSSASSTNPTCCWTWPATPTRFGDPVASVMSTRLETVPPDAPIERLLEIFEHEHVPIVVADGRVHRPRHAHRRPQLSAPEAQMTHKLATLAIHAGQPPDPDDRRGHDADLRDLDLRAGRAPACTRGSTTRARTIRRGGRTSAAWRRSNRAPTASRSRPAWRRRPRSSSCSTAARTSSRSTISTAARAACSSASGKRSAGLAVHLHSVRARRRAASARSSPIRSMIWVETPSNPLLKLVDLAAVAAIARSARHPQRSPTTRSRRRGCSARSSSASTSSCTRRPSTSTATRT